MLPEPTGCWNAEPFQTLDGSPCYPSTQAQCSRNQPDVGMQSHSKLWTAVHATHPPKHNAPGTNRMLECRAIPNFGRQSMLPIHPSTMLPEPTGCWNAEPFQTLDGSP